jgi:GntR family transcriptional regulator
MEGGQISGRRAKFDLDLDDLPVGGGDASTPLYRRIETVLEDLIRSGRIKPGEQVPPEVGIAAHFGVSRMTARKAVESLASKGLLVRHKGRGSYVTESPMAYGFSTMLSFSGTLRARGFDVRTKVLFKGVVAATGAAAETLQLPEGTSMLVVRRLRVVEGRPAAIHASYLSFDRFASLLDVDLSSQSLLSALENVLRQRIGYSEDSVEAGLAAPEDAALLEVPEGRPVLVVRGVAFTQSGVPIRLAHAVYLGSLFRFTVRNSADTAGILEFSSGTPGGA